jgi:FkbM family methyltransferase
MDAWIMKETCLDRDYEVNCVHIRDNWTVVDIGAGIGDFAVGVAKEHPNCRVYACEPFPESFSLFKENIELNAVQNVSEFQIAIGSESAEMTLAATGDAVQHTTTDSTVAGNAASRIKVQSLSLTDFFEVNRIEHCNFLKLDCEGCEFEILLNAGSEILQKIDHICLEYHDGFTEFSHHDLVDYLEQNGFRVAAIPNPVHKYLGFLHASR